jgi:hypothetical protein
MHKVVIWVNHSNFTETIKLTVILLPIVEGIDAAELEQRWVNVFGDFNLGWINTLFIVIPCLIFLVVFGYAHVGLGVFAAGLWMGFINLLINFGTIMAYTLSTIGGLLAIVGIVYIIVKRGRKRI